MKGHEHVENNDLYVFVSSVDPGLCVMAAAYYSVNITGRTELPAWLCDTYRPEGSVSSFVVRRLHRMQILAFSFFKKINLTPVHQSRDLSLHLKLMLGCLWCLRPQPVNI
jgi:hypothetical protein